MPKLIVPTPLRRFTAEQSCLDLQGNTVLDVIKNLTAAYPALQPHFFTLDGRLKNMIRFYINNEDIRALQNEQTPVADTTEISMIIAVAGG